MENKTPKDNKRLKIISKMVREILGYIVLAGIVLTTIILSSQGNKAIAPELLTIILAGGMTGITLIATNNRKPSEPKSE